MSNVISAEQLTALAELANQLAWKSPNVQVLKPQYTGRYPPIALSLQDHIKRSHVRGKLILPDLRAFNNASVGAFSDYGGESTGRYYTYSVLICGLNFVGPFHTKMKEIRERHGLGAKEIEFKDFRMGQLRRALPEYLEALDNLLPGFLFTLAVDKGLITLFGPSEKATSAELVELINDSGLGKRKPNVTEKLLRVVHLTAFLCGLLTHDGQRLFWMTDHDAICETELLHRQTLELFARVLPLYSRDGFKFPLLGGAKPFQEQSLEMLDLLSAADIVAGALDSYLTQRAAMPADDIRVKPGCELVLQWLAHDGIGLKKMCMLLRPGSAGTIEGATLDFALETLPPDAKMIPVVI